MLEKNILEKVRPYLKQQTISFETLVSLFDQSNEDEFKQVLEVLNENLITIEEIKFNIEGEVPPKSIYKEYQNFSNEKLYQMYLNEKDEVEIETIKMALLTSTKNVQTLNNFVKKYSYGKDIKEDLYNAGREGILYALEHFDKAKGASFDTYVYSCINFYIIDCSYSFQDFRISSGVRQKIRKLYDAIELNTDKSETELIHDFAKTEGIKEGKVKEYLNVISRNSIFSLDTATGDDEDSNIIDFFASSDLNPEEVWYQAQRDSKLYNEIMTKLDNREQDIIRKYFGLGDTTRESTLQIASDYGISTQRVSVILKNIFTKLKGNQTLKEIFENQRKNS